MSHYLQGFIHPTGGSLGFRPSTGLRGNPSNLPYICNLDPQTGHLKIPGIPQGSMTHVVSAASNGQVVISVPAHEVSERARVAWWEQ